MTRVKVSKHASLPGFWTVTRANGTVTHHMTWDAAMTWAHFMARGMGGAS